MKPPTTCPRCSAPLQVLRVRMQEGRRWQGPYYRCDGCGTHFHTENGRLVESPMNQE